MVNGSANNVTIDNQGSINGKVSGVKVEGGKVSTINNTGSIHGGSHYGIYLTPNASIDNFSNSGTITGTQVGIKLDSNSLIKTLNNASNGFINGIRVEGSGAVVQNLNNSGTISGSSGIKVDKYSTINTISNSGIIQSNSNGRVEGGILIRQYSRVDNIINNGLIQNQNSNKSGAIYLYAGHFNTLNNGKNGTIINKNGFGAIVLERVSGHASTGDLLDNKGTIISNTNGMVAIIEGKIKTINNEGTILANASAIDFGKGEIETILNNGVMQGGKNGVILNSVKTIENKGTILGQSGVGISIKGNVKDYIKLEGEKSLIAGGSVGIQNDGTIGVNNNGTSVNNGNVIDLQDGAIIAALTPNQDGSFSYNLAGDAILNEGTIKGNINLNNKANIYGAINNKNTITGNISLNNNSYASSIKNEKEIQGSIDLKDKSHIDSVINNGTIEKGINLDDSSISLVENSSSLDLNLKNHSEVGFLKNSGTITIDQDNTSNIASVDNTGNISGTITNNSNMIYVINKNTMENIVNKASLTKDESQTISQIINEGEKAHIKTIENQTQSSIGIIMNTGKVDSIINEGSISSAIGNGGFINDINNKANANIAHIKNEGTIDKIDNSGTIDKINNYIHGIINTINNQENANINIANQGEIKNGITNSGNMILSNLPSDYGAKSFIGKNNNGYHLENNNGGKLNIDGWYFNAPEYTTKEDRLQNSIIIGGNNLGGINADSIYINNKDIQQNIVYDANTFFINKEGESIGDKTNNNLGVDGNNIIDPTGIFNFVGVGNGGYMAHVDLDEVSGKTLAKSMVYSARLRNINISNILRDLNTKNFQTEFSQVLDMELSKKGEAYGNDADLLAELEDIFIPNKNPNAKNHTFLLPYYNHSSIKIGKSVGSLSSNTTGLIGGSFRELSNDYGTIGFYLGYEDASKEQATQRLKLDDKTYYGGLTYYGVLARDGINQYYISASTRLDYTKTDIEKTYKNNTATIDSDAKTYGYGVDVKVGANYYNTLDIARISPEIGLSYYGMSNKNFTLKHLGGLKEHYNGEQFNFIDASAALKWYKPWSDKIRSNITIGAIVNLYNDAQGSLKLGQNYFTTQIETSKYYGFGQLGLSYAIADNADLSLNYAGAFTFDNTTSHTMFLKLGLWW